MLLLAETLNSEVYFLFKINDKINNKKTHIHHFIVEKNKERYIVIFPH